MLVYLVYEHDYEGLNCRGVYDNLDAAIDHAKLIHQSACAEIHEVKLRSEFDQNVSEHRFTVWHSFDQSGAI